MKVFVLQIFQIKSVLFKTPQRLMFNQTEPMTFNLQHHLLTHQRELNKVCFLFIFSMWKKTTNFEAQSQEEIWKRLSLEGKDEKRITNCTFYLSGTKCTDRSHLEQSQERMASRLKAPPPMPRSVPCVPAYEVVRGDTYLKNTKRKKVKQRKRLCEWAKYFYWSKLRFFCVIIWHAHGVAEWLVTRRVDHVPQCLLWVLDAASLRVSVP